MREIGTSVVRRADQDVGRLDLAYETVYGRPPSTEERRLGLSLIDETRAARARSASETDGAKDSQQLEIDVWADFCHVLICSNEFLYVD